MSTSSPDSAEIGQALLDIEGKTRSNQLPWNGQFSPQLVEVLLEKYSAQGDRVLDPFVGSGTVLIEAARLGREVCGCEINPSAYLLSRLYTLSALSHERRKRAIEEMDSIVAAHLPAGALFDQSPSGASAPLVESLVARLRKTRSESLEVILGALVVLLNPSADKPVDGKKARAACVRLRNVVEGLPDTHTDVQVLHSDCRALPFRKQVFDLVVTSPPYINVFNYHQQFRGAAEALGWDVLNVARSEIGANRKHRGNRFLTVIQYALDMAMALSEMGRVLSGSGRAILVVGKESLVRGVSFRNGEIVARVAEAAVGLRGLLWQRRKFKNKFGAIIFEDVLHFSNEGTHAPLDLEQARLVGLDALEEGLQNAEGEVAKEIKEAISGGYKVKPSPMFSRTEAEGQLVRGN